MDSISLETKIRYMVEHKILPELFFSEKAKGKASSELIKAQMNIDAAKADLAAKKEAHDKASFEKYIDDTIEYAAACIELSILAAEEAKLATPEAIAAEQEYNEKYGSEE